MPELMAWADLAIAAGGSTNWELAFMGLPSVVITVAENQSAIAQPDREHVTPFILHQPERFNLIPILNSENHSHHRWTVDTPEDFELIKKILEAVYPQKPNFTMEDCLNLLKEHPEWKKINAHIEQKKYGE